MIHAQRKALDGLDYVRKILMLAAPRLLLFSEVGIQAGEFVIVDPIAGTDPAWAELTFPTGLDSVQASVFTEDLASSMMINVRNRVLPGTYIFVSTRLWNC